MKIHYFILQIARRRRRNYVFSFKRSMGEPLKIEEKCVLAAGICGQLGGPAGICGPRTTPPPYWGPLKDLFRPTEVSYALWSVYCDTVPATVVPTRSAHCAQSYE